MADPSVGKRLYDEAFAIDFFQAVPPAARTSGSCARTFDSARVNVAPRRSAEVSLARSRRRPPPEEK
jgi:hypothetical protein